MRSIGAADLHGENMAFEIEQPSDLDDQSAVVEPTKPRLLGVLGPGLITGASDDDPSGIATYSLPIR